MSSRGTRAAVLQNRSFLLLWSAQAVSQTAQNVVTFALVIYVEQLSSSSTQNSLVILSFIVPTVLVGPFAGVFVDRVDKRRVLLISNFLRAFVVFAYTAINPLWPVALALIAIYSLSAIFATISQFFTPAEASTIPLLVTRNQLPQANSLFNLTFTSSQLIGFALVGPLLIKLTMFNTLFIIVSLLYLICTLLVALLPPLTEGAQKAPATSLETGLKQTLKEIEELWVFISKQRAIMGAIIDLSITTSIFLMLGSLGVHLVTSVIGLPASDLAYILGAGGVGVLTGLWLVPRIIPNRGSQVLITAGLAIMGTTILSIASIGTLFSLFTSIANISVNTSIVLFSVMVMAAGFGLGSAFVSIPAQTLIQEWSPPSLRGRVFATLFTVTSALSIIPVLFTGALADIIGPTAVLALIGISTLVLALFARKVKLATPS